MPVKAIHRGKRFGVVKRSVRIAGRRTAVSLEDPFWDAMHEIAIAKGTTRANLIAQINQTRSNTNLSSASRALTMKACAHEY
jgi:predicted DNA-binding ribbon-helix-helix protein